MTKKRAISIQVYCDEKRVRFGDLSIEEQNIVLSTLSKIRDKNIIKKLCHSSKTCKANDTTRLTMKGSVGGNIIPLKK